MDAITLTIDDTEVVTKRGATVLEVAWAAGIYIPALCHHPDIPPAPGTKVEDHVYRGGELIKSTNSNPMEFEGCQLCVVEIEGMEGFPTACNTPATDGMVVHTNTPQVQGLRRDNLARILANHPHACLLCEEMEGCIKEDCSFDVPVNERCCDKFGLCELQKVAEYIGIREDIPRYVFRNLPVEETPLFVRDHNLCIECSRCVRVCRDIRGVGALGIAYHDGDFIVGTVGPSLKESECKFCGACVEVCPTGSIMDAGLKWPPREEDLIPCKYTCPGNVDIPRFVRLIGEGKFSEAAAVIREKVPFPAVLGYVCHHPCESKCRRGKLNEPIAMCALKRFAAEHDTGLWKTRSKAAPRTGKCVAIVGSGPTGLTAAYYLAKKGHAVTVFESLPEPGGMTRIGIPEFRLPKKTLQKEIDDILKQGVEIKFHTPIGEKLTLNALNNQGYQAIFLATGAQVSRKLNIEGEEHEGVLHALDFLKEVNLGKKVELGEKVAVVGGANVAVDAARTALRLGCKEPHLMYRRSRQEMPAEPDRVKKLEEEGVKIHFLVAPKKILEKNGKVAAVEWIKMMLGEPDKSGRRRPIPIEGSEHIMELDGIIVAIGQSPDLTFFPQGIETTKRNTVVVNSDTLETSLPGVFVGGDVVSGPASIIEAISAGRKGAVSIDKYLGGDGDIDEILIKTKEPNPWLGREEGFADRRRVQMPCLPVEEREQGFSVVELGFNEEEAVKEAKRCLQCDLRLQISPVMLPPEKWLEFNSQNVSTVPETNGVYQLLDEEKMIILIAGTPNLRHALEEKLETVQKARYFGYEEEPMYTMRESELISKFLKEHGRMPELNDELADLF